MPELPEVETMRRGALETVGKIIVDVQAARCRRKPISIQPRLSELRRRVRDKRVTDAQRFGKRVALRLEDEQLVVFEPRMTGLLLIDEPPSRQHLRLTIVLRSGKRTSHLHYWDRRGLGTVRLLAPRQQAALLGPPRLGPDALALRTAAQLADRLERSRRPIKVALLDQQALAGIGNLYASEILHVAGVHPAIACNRLRRDQWQSIHAAMLSVLQEAIRYEGSTLSDGTYRNALNQSGSYQLHHRVYARGGQPCKNCPQGIITRIVQAQRSTFFCTVCQKLSTP